MRIEIHTSNPTALLEKIKKDIKDEAIKTWAIVPNKEHDELLTHKPEQWFKKALLKPSIMEKPERLVMTITWFSGLVPTEYIKGLYVGRFTEALLEHYRTHFTKLETFA